MSTLKSSPLKPFPKPGHPKAVMREPRVGRRFVHPTQVVLMKSTSKGMQGTIDNAKHHAMYMLPFILELKDEVDKLGFVTHKAGHNVHEFITWDGRRYTLRALLADEPERGENRYIGVRLSLRVGRSEEYPIFDIDRPNHCRDLLELMAMLAWPAKGISRTVASPFGG